MAAVWAVPHNPGCPASPWDQSPAIARVADECVYSHQFATYLRDLSLNLGISGEESPAAESPLPQYFEARNRLVTEFGVENAAFATLALEVALYQAAASRGYEPRRDEATAFMGQARERISGLQLLVELHGLARASDLPAFRALIDSPAARQLLPVQGEEHLLLLFEQARQVDLTGAMDGLAVHQTLLESVGPDRYWTEVYVEHARRLLAIDAFRSSVVDAEADWSGARDWLDFSEHSWNRSSISLMDAAPNSLSINSIQSYMDRNLSLQRDFLESQLDEARPSVAPPSS